MLKVSSEVQQFYNLRIIIKLFKGDLFLSGSLLEKGLLKKSAINLYTVVKVKKI